MGRESPGKFRAIWVAGCACSLLAAGTATAREKPVVKLAAKVFTLQTSDGEASLPIDASLDWSAPLPAVTRVAIVFHGKGRNVEGYYRALETAARTAGANSADTLLVAPQFLREEDVEAHRLPKTYLRWHGGGWSAGESAEGPAALSSFDVIDALLAVLGDRTHFRNLREVVLVGHSGGGQLLNRYAIVGRGPAALASAGIHVRFVIANPSSFLYFDDERPLPDGSFSPYQAASCPNFNRWRYGPAGAPAYVAETSAAAWAKREADYVATDVIYLLGEDDTDPDQVDLDTSCAGEAEGPQRFARGNAYFRYLQLRHPTGFQQQLWLVPGVAHFGNRMVDAPCGVAAIFDTGKCATVQPP
jgi:hypothetical protein